eukprot:g18079.t1
MSQRSLPRLRSRLRQHRRFLRRLTWQRCTCWGQLWWSDPVFGAGGCLQQDSVNLLAQMPDLRAMVQHLQNSGTAGMSGSVGGAGGAVAASGGLPGLSASESERRAAKADFEAGCTVWRQFRTHWAIRGQRADMAKDLVSTIVPDLIHLDDQNNTQLKVLAGIDVLDFYPPAGPSLKMLVSVADHFDLACGAIVRVLKFGLRAEVLADAESLARIQPIETAMLKARATFRTQFLLHQGDFQSGKARAVLADLPNSDFRKVRCRAVCIRKAAGVSNSFFCGARSSESRTVLLMDNLHAQTTTAFTDYLSKHFNTLASYFPTNTTNELQPVDAGAGRMLKVGVGKLQDAWLEEAANVGKMGRSPSIRSAEAGLDGTYVVVGKGGDDEILDCEKGRRPNLERDKSQRKPLLRELEAMIRLRSPHTVNVFGAITSLPDRLILAMELLAGGDLRTLLKMAEESLPEEQCRRIIGDMLLA